MANKKEKSNVTVFNEPVKLKEYHSEKPYYEIIEEARKEVFENQKRSASRGKISILIISILSIIGMTLAIIKDNHPEHSWLSILVWVCVGLAVASLLVFSLFNRRIDRPDYKGYVYKSYVSSNAYIFDDPRFDVTYDNNEKFDLSDISEDGLYSVIRNIHSRNVVEGTFDGHTFKMCECGIYKDNRGRNFVTNFVGKLIKANNDLHFQDRYVVVSNYNSGVDIPDAIGDLVTLYEKGDLRVFGKQGSNYKEDLGTKVIPLIEKLNIENDLLNATFVFWAGKTSVYLSYKDKVIMLPLKDPFVKSGYEQLKKDLAKVFDALLETYKD